MANEFSQMCLGLIKKHREVFASASVPDPNAVVQYDMMSDGLIWSDELPALDGIEFEDIGLVRVLWHYRARLILGESCEEYREVWEQAKLAFPQWMGFASERCVPTPDLADLFRKRKSRADRSIRRIFKTS